MKKNLHNKKEKKFKVSGPVGSIQLDLVEGGPNVIGLW